MPQPRTQNEKTEPDTADGEPTFAVADLVGPRGEQITGFLQPDLIGAFHGVPRDRALTVASAKKRVREWLDAPAKTETD